MWKVFEDFVATALTEGLRRYPGVTRTQYKRSLDVPPPGKAEGEVSMRIDIAHLVGGKPVAVFDAKYKAADSSGRYPNADHYQVLAYCTSLNLDRGWLIYAGGSGGSVERRIRNSPVRVVEYPLDLSVRPGELVAQLVELGRDAWAAQRAG